MDDVLARPEFSHHVTIRPKRGDFGVVAEAGGPPSRSAGPGFSLLRTPGYGFVDEQTAEISLWVSSEARGQGLG